VPPLNFERNTLNLLNLIREMLNLLNQK